jgi:hypothetical protein
MTVEERQFKTYGYVRLGLYAAVFFFSSMVWMIVVLTVLPRLVLFLRSLSGFPYFSLGLIFVLSGVTAFWVVNYWLIVPTSTLITSFGFTSKAPFHRNGTVAVQYSEIGTIFELGFGTLVTVHTRQERRSYTFIFGKDTDGYYHLIDSLKDGLNEFRTVR